MSNLEIGKRIRTLRTEKGLSREAFCGDEKELTVRQLGRIETGLYSRSVRGSDVSVN